MAERRGIFGPSEAALGFGAQYADVLAKWGELFVAASSLVQANVELGKMANESAKEFDGFLQQTAAWPTIRWPSCPVWLRQRRQISLSLSRWCWNIFNLSFTREYRNHP